MKYLHLITPSIRVMNGYLKMHQHYLYKEHHDFLTHRETLPSDQALLVNERVKDYSELGKGKLKKFNAIKKLFKKYDCIVLHGLVVSNKWILWLYLNQSVLRKCIWFIWGMDLYNYRLPNNSIKNKIINHMNDTVRKKIAYPCVNCLSDRDYYEKVFGKERKIYVSSNPTSDETFQQLDEILEKIEQIKTEEEKRIQEQEDAIRQAEEARAQAQAELEMLELKQKEKVKVIKSKTKDKSKIIDKSQLLIPKETALPEIPVFDPPKPNLTRIMVGNNAHSFNKHHYILGMLEKFRKENIRIVIPVNYGEDTLNGAHYVDNLKKYTSSAFGSKAACMTKFLQLKEYHEFLGSVNIAIFNANRANAMGNITKLLYLGKKIYLNKKENPMFKYLVADGIPIHDVEELRNATFEEFCTEETKDCKQWVLDNFSERGAAEKWKNVFEEVEKDLANRGIKK